jgi:Phosphoenolpyruvate synthase/pyruvate phosphate dikinase
MIADYLQLIMKIRDRRKNFFAKGLTVIYRIAEKMFKEADLPLDLIPFYTMQELVKGPDYLKKNAQNLVNRKAGFQLFIPSKGEVKMSLSPINKAVDEVNSYYLSSESSESNGKTLKGQIGCKGIVRGKVRIVLNVNSDHGFTDGEILVTGMTRPEFVPLMKKAAGIVTDEGGITCHAAIVSRELKIPCITGTKIATQILKDGDLVEVDAEKGVVKILQTK